MRKEEGAQGGGGKRGGRGRNKQFKKEIKNTKKTPTDAFKSTYAGGAIQKRGGPRFKPPHQHIFTNSQSFKMRPLETLFR